MEKNMFFIIPEMPSKTFVMVLKNFLITLRESRAGLVIVLRKSLVVKLKVLRSDLK